MRGDGRFRLSYTGRVKLFTLLLFSCLAACASQAPTASPERSPLVQQPAPAQPELASGESAHSRAAAQSISIDIDGDGTTDLINDVGSTNATPAALEIQLSRKGKDKLYFRNEALAFCSPSYDANKKILTLSRVRRLKNSKIRYEANFQYKDRHFELISAKRWRTFNADICKAKPKRCENEFSTFNFQTGEVYESVTVGNDKWEERTQRSHPEKILLEQFDFSMLDENVIVN